MVLGVAYSIALCLEHVNKAFFDERKRHKPEKKCGIDIRRQAQNLPNRLPIEDGNPCPLAK